MATLRNIFTGTRIFAKYEELDSSIVAEHDILYCGNTHPDQMDDDDVCSLQYNGWVWNGDGWILWT